jgi:hypothetical protein
MLLTQQNFMLAALLALSSSIVMHQSSYTVYNNHDIFRRGTLRQILWLLMGICINAEADF